jgi:biopolymer transport protein ExbB
MKKQFKYIFTVLVVFASSLAMAQMNVGDRTAADEAPAQIVKEISTLEFIMKGGFFLIPIAILLFISLAIMVERYLYIRNMSKYNKHLLSEIKTNLQAGNIPPVLDTLSRDNTAFGNVVREGVLTIGRPISQIESNLEKVVNIEIGKMEKNIGILGLIAGVAPTFGFIGTISGVIKIFYNISISENVSIGNISGGLYEKMISSGSGLIVGIVAFTAYHILNGMIDNYALAIQKVNLEFVNLIQRPSNGDKA